MHSSNHNDEQQMERQGVSSESQQGDAPFNPSTASSNRDKDGRSARSGAETDNEEAEEGSKAEEEDGEEEEEEEEEYLSDMDEETDLAVVQENEQFDCPVFQSNRDKPMMEIEAGSNVWYQAGILQESWNEVRVLFPAPTEDDQEVREWVKKNSSRIWRGSLKSRDWKYLGKGAWEPRPSASKNNRAKSRSNVARPKRRRQVGGKRTGSTAEDTATGTGTSEAAQGGGRGEGGGGDDEDVASPRAKKPRRLAPSGSAQQQREAEEEEEEQVGGPRRPLLGEEQVAGDEVSSVSREEGQQNPGGSAATAGDNASGPSCTAGVAGGGGGGGPVDPLAGWFELHFSLLQEKGLLGSNAALDNPEAGCVPPPDDGTGSLDQQQQHPHRGRGTGLRELQGLAPWGWERGKAEESGEESGSEGEAGGGEPRPDRQQQQRKWSPEHRRRQAEKEGEGEERDDTEEEEDEQPCPVRHKQLAAGKRRALQDAAHVATSSDERPAPLPGQPQRQRKHDKQQPGGGKQLQQRVVRSGPAAWDGSSGRGSVSPDAGRAIKSMSPHQASSPQDAAHGRRPSDSAPAAAAGSSQAWPGSKHVGVGLKDQGGGNGQQQLQALAAAKQAVHSENDAFGDAHRGGKPAQRKGLAGGKPGSHTAGVYKPRTADRSGPSAVRGPSTVPRDAAPLPRPGAANKHHGVGRHDVHATKAGQRAGGPGGQQRRAAAEPSLGGSTTQQGPGNVAVTGSRPLPSM